MAQRFSNLSDLGLCGHWAGHKAVRPAQQQKLMSGLFMASLVAIVDCVVAARIVVDEVEEYICASDDASGITALAPSV